MKGSGQMNNKITRESWELIATEIINICENGRDYGTDYYTKKDLEEYLTNEGIITVIDD